MKKAAAAIATLFAVLTTFHMPEAISADPAPGVAGRSPWGPADEIGSLNRMTLASRHSALNAATSGKVYDLGVELFVGMPDCCSEAFGDPTFQLWMIHAPSRGDSDELLSHSSEAILMNTHSGTHLDTLSHFGLNGEIWNEVGADDALSVRGWSKSGAETIPPIISRGVLIDLPAAQGVEVLPPSYAITVEDLQEALNRQKSVVLPGDSVLLRTGQMSLWPDRRKIALFQQPGLSLEAARWLAEEKQVLLLGADNLGLEKFPSSDPNNFAPVHSYLLAEKGVPFLELLWLEELAGEKVYEFLFIASPLKLRGASGAPVRPIAIPIRSDR